MPDFVIIAFTHLQPAEPSTLGYRFAVYAQDLANDYQVLCYLRKNLRGKGFKGAVGTGASYADLIGVENLKTFPIWQAKYENVKNVQHYPHYQAKC